MPGVPSLAARLEAILYLKGRPISIGELSELAQSSATRWNKPCSFSQRVMHRGIQRSKSLNSRDGIACS